MSPVKLSNLSLIIIYWQSQIKLILLDAVQTQNEKNNHMGGSSWESTPENSGLGIKINLSLFRGRKTRKNNDRLCRFYLITLSVVGTVLNNKQDTVPTP